MIAIAYITAPRPVLTLERSLASMRDAGFDQDIRIFSDGSVDCRLDENMYVRRNVPLLGNLRNWLKALRTLVEITQEPFLMVCEDDILWAKNSHRALRDDLFNIQTWEGFGCLSLYLPIRMSKMCEKAESTSRLRDGIHSHGMQIGFKMWGAQCLVLSRASAHALLDSAELHNYLEGPKHWDKNVDGIVSACFQAIGLTMFWRVPCLVNHTLGEANSSLGYPPDRFELTTKYWTGDAWPSRGKP
ncbi:MAG: hypothetical protein EHM78_02175 [Myxococcaceae bacterium]|nr:MAG: hypothetical protein EHM78_02175 [Myxococcaceae bacterium]